ncbi:MAG: hypothetical protein SO170_00210 [Butyribacter sp.]|nr:hypothetical protein [Butyribacter sp.]
MCKTRIYCTDDIVKTPDICNGKESQYQKIGKIIFETEQKNFVPADRKPRQLGDGTAKERGNAAVNSILQKMRSNAASQKSQKKQSDC